MVSPYAYVTLTEHFRILQAAMRNTRERETEREREIDR